MGPQRSQAGMLGKEKNYASAGLSRPQNLVARRTWWQLVHTASSRSRVDVDPCPCLASRVIGVDSTVASRGKASSTSGRFGRVVESGRSNSVGG